jgi:hypothetical protein
MPNAKELYEILKAEFFKGIYLLETKLNNSKYEVIEDPLHIHSQVNDKKIFIYHPKKSEYDYFGTWNLILKEPVVYFTINRKKYNVVNYDGKHLILIDSKVERRIFEKYNIQNAENNL